VRIAQRHVLPITLTLAVLTVGAAPVPEPAAEEGYVVRVAPSAMSAVAQQLDDLGADVDEVFTEAVDGFAVQLTDRQAAAVSRIPGVTDLEAETPVSAVDPVAALSTGMQVQTPTGSWGLDRLDQAGLPLDGRYRYDPVAGDGVTVYVVDSGIAPWVTGLRPGYSVVNDGNGTADCNGHGTHVAGTIRDAHYGVTKEWTSIVPVRVADCDGQSTSILLVDGLDWIANDHRPGDPAVVNISMGGPRNAAVNDAVAHLVDLGITVVVAAGNEDADACDTSPASEPSAITVAATTSADVRAGYSNFGSCVDLFAPGSSITSLWYLGPGYSAIASGTSMASPHVAGLAASLLGAWGTATPAQVTASILAHAHRGKVGDPAGTANLLASNEGLTLPAPPAGLRVAQLTPTSVAVTWRAGTGPAPDAYKPVLTGGGLTRTARTSGTSYEFTDLEPSTSYRITVRAERSSGYTSATIDTATLEPPGTERLWGSTRVETAVAVSQASFSPGVPVAYVATASTFPDALAGGAAAAMNRGPVLLTTGTSLPDAVTAELVRLRPGRIVVLGGAGAVPDAVVRALRSYTTGNVTRLWGSTRIETAAAVSRASFSPGVPVAYVATASNFPDALAGAAVAGMQGGPVLLTSSTSLPDVVATELGRLRPGRIVVLGGTGVVSSAVLRALRSYTTGSVTRLSGADRFETAAAVSRASFSPGVPVAYVATASNFPDALAGAAVAGMQGGPVLLTSSTSLPDVVATELGRLQPGRIVALGGTGAVSGAVSRELGGYVVAP
jgi:subtilisin family serine protease/putative cell wall-binding protein